MKFSPDSRGIIQLPSLEYGRSVLGAPLLYYPCKSECKLLVMAGIHGEEPETTFLLSRVLRAFDEPFEFQNAELFDGKGRLALDSRSAARYAFIAGSIC